MDKPENVSEYVLTSKPEIAAALNQIRRRLELHLDKGPIVVHLSRQLLEGAVVCDDHDRLKIKAQLGRSK